LRETWSTIADRKIRWILGPFGPQNDSLPMKVSRLSMNGNRVYAMLALLLCARVLSAQIAHPTAIEQLTKLRQEAHAAIAAGDQKRRLELVLEIQKLVHNSPASLETVAQAYAAAGDEERAIAALDQLADMGQSDDDLLQGKDKGFARLQRRPAYQEVLKKFAENEKPVSHAETAFVLADANLLAEDIDYDPRTKSFLITSVLEKKIVRVAQDGKAMDFAQSPSGWPILAVKVDAQHNHVWAAEVALDGFKSVASSDWGRSAVLCFDLRSGALLRRIEGPPHSALGDMTLTRQGDPIVSDGDGGGVYRVQGDTLLRIDRGDFISPQTPVMHPDGRHVFVPDYTRGIGVLDLASKNVSWLGQGGAKPYVLNGVDGLYFDQGWLILVQNGASPERVLRLQLDSTYSRVVAEEIIERATPTLGDPTHGVIVDHSFYYIANSGWYQVDNHGVLQPGAAFTPARIMRFGMR
jgi:sugar lactone lactonase YvrE